MCEPYVGCHQQPVECDSAAWDDVVCQHIVVSKHGLLLLDAWCSRVTCEFRDLMLDLVVAMNSYASAFAPFQVKARWMDVGVL